MQIYKHIQKGALPLYAVVFAAMVTALFLLLVSASPARAMLSVTLLTLGLCIFIFWSLTVVVTLDRLAVWYGPGLIHRTFVVADILDVRLVRTPWYYGWGIRLTPHGWLFNVSGFDAVELELSNQRKFLIGTDEPQRLLAAIQQAIRPRASQA